MKNWIYIILVLCSLRSYSQDFRAKNLQNFDHSQLFHFGAYLGYNSYSLDVRFNERFHSNESIYSLQVQSMPGFNIGIIADMHLGNNFDIRSLPALTFASRSLNYGVMDEGVLTTETRLVESTFFEIPVLAKFKSNRIGNTRVYLLGGGRVSYDFASNINVDEDDKSVVRFQKVDYGYEVGFGFDFYLQYFKFAPEIRIYNGLRDILGRDGTPYTTTIDKVFSQSVYISLTFEG
jgi:hypothetical protein